MNTIYLLWDLTDSGGPEDKFVMCYYTDKEQAEKDADRMSREWHRKQTDEVVQSGLWMLAREYDATWVRYVVTEVEHA